MQQSTIAKATGMMRYNIQTGFPFPVQLPLAIPLTITTHARQAAQNDRYGQIPLDSYISTKDAILVEFETDQRNIITKIVLRKSHNAQLDVVYVIVQGGILVTVWFNQKEDKHSTFRANRMGKIA